jgi:uncharacterized membrane protein YdbT with pleckstrin-like domain
VSLAAPELEDIAAGARADADAVIGIDEAPAAAVQLLDGGEIVEFSIKPSLWFILLSSLRVIVMALAMATGVAIFALGGGGGWTPRSAVFFAAIVCVALVRILIGSLQWASRVYVLTNRRVMRVSGVLDVSVVDCPLARISAAHVRMAVSHRLLRLGTIRMTPADDRLPTVNWEHVSRPALIHERLVRAIHRAQS